MESISQKFDEGYSRRVRRPHGELPRLHPLPRETPCRRRDRTPLDGVALLANISLATESTLHWDPERQLITNLPEANDLLHYEYRKPWTLEDA